MRAIPVGGPARFRVAVGLLALVVFVLSVLVGTTRGIGPEFFTQGDAQYDVYATHLVDEGRFLDDSVLRPGGRPDIVEVAYRPPGYPSLLAVAYLAAGRSALTVIVLQALLAALAAVLAAVLGRRVSGSGRLGLVAGAVAAFFPYSFVQNVGLIDTALTTVLVVGTVLAALATAARASPTTVVACGLCGAGAVLTRPAAVFVVVVVLLWLLVQRVRPVAVLAALGIMTTGVGLWILRDGLVLGDLPFVATNGGWNLWLGNNAQSTSFLVDGRLMEDLEWARGGWPELVGLPETQRDDAARSLALSWIASTPVAAAWGLAVKAWYTIMPILRPGGGGAKGALFTVTGGVLYAGAVAGLVLRRRSAWAGLFAAVIVATAVPMVVFFPYTRMFASVFPLMAVALCVAVYTGRRARMSGRRDRRTLAATTGGG